MYPQSMFEQNKKKNIKKSSENKHFYSREILLYIAWACLRNVEELELQRRVSVM